MQLYSEHKNYKLYEGNMLDMLEYITPNSVDSIVTDPPYELNFMGKGWDNSGIAFQKETWEKCFEVLKPGGYLLAFGGTRTFYRIACAIEDAGFEIRDTIMWLYGSGFPKSMDISKQIDKRNAKDFDTRSLLAKHIRDSISSVGKTKEDLLKRFNGSAKVNHWLSSSNTNFYQPNHQEYEILVDEFGCSWDYYVEEADREVVGIRKGCLNNWGGKNNLVDRDITIPSTDLAKQWNGWGTALKPAYEPIIVARKPCEGSCIDNVIKYGVGGINIDECRVGDETISYYPTDLTQAHSNNFGTGAYMPKDTSQDPISHVGRYPSNVILTYDDTDFDEVSRGMPDTKGGTKNSGYGFDINTRNEYNDEGSAARYFYCAKASNRDRDEGLDDFETTQDPSKGNGLGRVCEFCGAPQLHPELCHCEIKSWVLPAKKNIHPTVKPCELMQYLVRLVTPKGGTILDPFNGSGSTGKAVMYENKDRDSKYKYIGIELTHEYLPISDARISYVANMLRQYKLF